MRKGIITVSVIVLLSLIYLGIKFDFVDRYLIEHDPYNFDVSYEKLESDLYEQRLDEMAEWLTEHSKYLINDDNFYFSHLGNSLSLISFVDDEGEIEVAEHNGHYGDYEKVEAYEGHLVGAIYEAEDSDEYIFFEDESEADLYPVRVRFNEAYHLDDVKEVLDDFEFAEEREFTAEDLIELIDFPLEDVTVFNVDEFDANLFRLSFVKSNERITVSLAYTTSIDDKELTLVFNAMPPVQRLFDVDYGTPKKLDNGRSVYKEPADINVFRWEENNIEHDVIIETEEKVSQAKRNQLLEHFNVRFLQK